MTGPSFDLVDGGELERRQLAAGALTSATVNDPDGNLLLIVDR